MVLLHEMMACGSLLAESHSMIGSLLFSAFVVNSKLTSKRKKTKFRERWILSEKDVDLLQEKVVNSESRTNRECSGTRRSLVLFRRRCSTIL